MKFKTAKLSFGTAVYTTMIPNPGLTYEDPRKFSPQNLSKIVNPQKLAPAEITSFTVLEFEIFRDREPEVYV